jgi:hypothetical protein
MVSKAKLVEYIFTALPAPRVSGLDLDSKSESIEFTWGTERTKFRISTSLQVEEVQGHLLYTSDKAELIRNIFARAAGLII